MLVRLPQFICRAAIPRHVRAYAVSLGSSQIFPEKPAPRVYSKRKTYLHNQYTRLFQSSFEHPLIFLRHSDFSASRLIQLRRDITAATARHAKLQPPTLAGPSPAAAPAPPTLTILRTSVFGVALRDFSPFDRQTKNELASVVDGTLAVLSFPTFSPPQINAILRTLAKAVPPRAPKTKEQFELERKEVEALFVPGRRFKRQRPPPIPDLRLVGALIEGRVFKAPGVWEVAGLPTLETLRAQLVGMLSAPAMHLSMVLSEASGGKLYRTLEGFKKGLEDGAESGAKDGQA